MSSQMDRPNPQTREKEVSFLEFVQVASTNADLDHLHHSLYRAHPQPDSLSSTLVLDYGAAQHEPRCSLSDLSSSLVHYEPLRPPAAMPAVSCTTDTTASFSSSISSPLTLSSSLSIPPTSAALNIPTSLNVFLSSSSCSSACSSSPTPTLISLESFRGALGPASMLPPPDSMTYCLTPQCSYDFRSQQQQQQQQSGAVFSYPGENKRIASHTPPLRQVIQFWPQTSGTALSVIPETESFASSMLQVSNLSAQANLVSPPLGGTARLSPAAMAMTVISKSSSSDSDTNDSATRLITSHDNGDNSLVDDSHKTSLFVLPDVLQATSPAKETTTSSENVNWIPMQSDVSENLRKNYLKQSKRPKRSREDKRKSFTFHRYGTRRFGFVCPLKPTTARNLLLLTVVFVIVSGLAAFLGLCWSNRWFPFDGEDEKRYGLDGDPHWWRGTTFYHVFPASFRDSDGDGFGDLEGIREKVSYLRSLGVSTLRLSSIFAAMDYPQRYENVIDFNMVDPHLGRQADFYRLVETLHANHIRVVLDWNPTITSDQHLWANEWRRASTIATNGSEGSEFARFYEPYKNRTSSASSLRLNWSHEPVRAHLLKVADFWLRTVDGFYLTGLENVAVEGAKQTRTQVLRSFLQSLQAIAKRAERRQQRQGSRWVATKVLITSSSLVEGYLVRRKRRKRQQQQANSKASAAPEFDELELPPDERQPQQLNVNFHVMPSNRSSKANETNVRNRPHRRLYNYFHLIGFGLHLEDGRVDNVRDQVNNVYLNSPPDFPLALWSLSDLRHPRLATRLGDNRTLAAHFLLSMLPGSVCLFYGDEIGLGDVYDRPTGNKYGDGQLALMAWTSASPNGNFSWSNISSSQLWLPVSPDYGQVNVERRGSMVRSLSDLNHFRLDNLYTEPPEVGTTTSLSSSSDATSDVRISLMGQTITTATPSLVAATSAASSSLSSFSSSARAVNYLFHYIDGSIICFEQYFDRKLRSQSAKRFRFVIFANFGDEPVVRDFSDKFHYSSILLATDLNRTSQFLILPSLQLGPGEALIVLVE